MAEYIYEIVKDADGIDCYIERGEIVRCNDCKHYQGLAECEIIGACMGTFGFCSWGERREDEH